MSWKKRLEITNVSSTFPRIALPALLGWHLDLCLVHTGTWDYFLMNKVSIHDSLIWGKFSSVQSLSRVWLFATSWMAARQASLSITNSWGLLKVMAIESVDATQPSHPLSSPSPSTFNHSQNQERKQRFLRKW